MGNFSEWELYGKHGNGEFFSGEQLKLLLNIVDELAYVWYAPEVGGEYFCSFVTVYRSSYKEVTDAIEEFSKTMPDAVFCLQRYDNDCNVHQRIYLNNGTREEVDGRVVYDLPKIIQYYDLEERSREL